jgi:hypothetical protein
VDITSLAGVTTVATKEPQRKIKQNNHKAMQLVCVAFSFQFSKRTEHCLQCVSEHFRFLGFFDKQSFVVKWLWNQPKPSAQ